MFVVEPDVKRDVQNLRIPCDPASETLSQKTAYFRVVWRRVDDNI